METEVTNDFENFSLVRQASETDPLVVTRNKPFYRPRPLWLVPFALTAALVRGMTLAPRIEIYTQLSCNNRYHHTEIPTSLSNPNAQSNLPSFYFTLDPSGPQLHPHSTPALYHNLAFQDVPDPKTETEEDPRRLPSARCISDPAVQAGAARLQTIMTTTMGFLSALTTGWWGHFGERHGRTKVLAISTFGLLMTDLIFILVSTPSSPMSSHGHKLLLLSPFIEGLLGGWSTLQSATSAYLSDCTSSGSRASIFSRFSGVFYIGLSIGPSLGGYLIKNPIWGLSTPDDVPTVTSVFWVAIICSFVNFILVLFLFPESLDKIKMVQAASRVHVNADTKGKARSNDPLGVGEGSEGNAVHGVIEETGILQKFLKPLELFLPAVVADGGLRKRKDWSMTIMGMALFGYMLAQGVYQLKYLYAEHIYGWRAEQLSHYISFLSVTKVIFLLLLLPWIINTFKPKPRNHSAALSTVPGQKSQAHLIREMTFDLSLTCLSLLVEALSNALVALSPLPSSYGNNFKNNSQTFFVAATSLGSMGSGAIPAMHSFTLCMLQVRALGSESSATDKGPGVAELFSAFAVLSAVGQTIFGPMLFGLVYSGTVAKYPKAIFVTAAGLLLGSLTMMISMRVFIRWKSDRPVDGTKGKKKAREDDRGRSRVSKDLRGGATGYGSLAGSSSV